MRESQKLRKRIESANELLGVVRTMKALASVHIRQYETAVESTREYMATIEQGFQVVLANRPELVREGTSAAEEPVGVVAFGSDQGMCGSFNERVAEHARQTLASRGLTAESCTVVVVGHRLEPGLADAGWSPYDTLELPGAIEGFPAFVRNLLARLAAWRDALGIERVLLFYNRLDEAGRSTPCTEELLPLDRSFLQGIADRPWASRCEPMMSLSADALFGDLVEEYLYVGLFRACAESLASENAARLSSMQAARKNIAERLEELRRAYRRSRQSSITAELLDIVSGYEALSE